ncbi:hypothetical protein Y1Q_0022480 [Alligator mississippiensis]|uniref:Uncharacterized protein n=1 Tax=Alligator mississippiensis TaxID=8496 RepID=A0A151N0U4_ALLMI|nr:hypothetical protein Y1Q_0022480 [Alligator mississippiensis]
MTGGCCHHGARLGLWIPVQLFAAPQLAATTDLDSGSGQLQQVVGQDIYTGERARKRHRLLEKSRLSALARIKGRKLWSASLCLSSLSELQYLSMPQKDFILIKFITHSSKKPNFPILFAK